MKSIKINVRCIACKKIGASSRSHSFIEIKGREYGICFIHARSICDKSTGEWKKTPFGKLPIKDQVYGIRNNDVTLLGVGGIVGKV